MRASALLLAAVLLVGCSGLSVDLSPRIQPLVEQTVEGAGDAKIVLLDLTGLITDEGTNLSLNVLGGSAQKVPLLARVREELKKAADDDRVKALIVRINSAGGTVTASDIIFRELEAFKGLKKIPVVSVLMDVAASGGYYVAIAGDTIIAHPTTITGSIGVIVLTANAQGLLEKIGVSTAAIKSGLHKDMASPLRPMTAEERAILQSVVDELHRQFIGKVAQRRRLSIERVRALADGRVYTAEQARASGLVDEIGYIDDAVMIAKHAAGVKEARVVVYHRPREYRATYYAQAAGESLAMDTALGRVAALFGGLGPRFMYIWMP